MSKFKVGDIAVGQNLIEKPEHNNMECAIKLDLSVRNVRWADGTRTTDELVYIVEWADSDGEFKAVRSQNLRKKKPPQELGRWEDVEEFTGWSPFKVTVPKEIA